MQNRQPKRWILIGIPVLFLVGAMIHVLYKWSGQNPVVGAFVPVNESVWEHLKMVTIPIILWWLLYYVSKRNRYKIKPKGWFTGALVAVLSALLSIPLLYYFYTGAFGIESVVVDVLILLIAVTIGQLLGLYVYKHAEGLPVILAGGLFIIMVLGFVFVTFHTPHLPLFKDSRTGNYGIG